MESKKKKSKKNTNVLIIIVAIIFVLSLVAALIILQKSEDSKDSSNNKTTNSQPTSSIKDEVPITTEETTEEETTTTKTTVSIKTTKSTESTTVKKTTVKKTTNNTSADCDMEELNRIADANRPEKYAVWKTEPKFNVPSGIEYDIGYQKFFWMWYQIGTINGEPNFIWVVASDKESGMGYPKGEGNVIHERNPSGHFKNAMKYMIAKPTTDGTKEGERRGVVSLYYYTGVTVVGCN